MDDNFYCISVEYTKRYGILKAAILSRIEFWCDYNEKNKVNGRFIDGYWWSGYLSTKDISIQLGIPKKTIDKNIAILLKNDVIIRGRYNAKGYDKTNWYRLNPILPESITYTPIEYNLSPNRVQPYPPIEYNLSSNRVQPIPQESIPIPVNPVNHFESSDITPVITPVNPKKKFEVDNILKLLPEKFEDELAYMLKNIVQGPFSLTNSQREYLNEKKAMVIAKLPIMKNYINNI